MSDINNDLPPGEEDRLVEQMGEVRGDLEGDIDRLGEEMQHLFDWQAYVRSAPLTSVGLAAAVGYLLAPSLGSSSATGERSTGLSGFITKIAMASVAQIASVS